MDVDGCESFTSSNCTEIVRVTVNTTTTRQQHNINNTNTHQYIHTYMYTFKLVKTNRTNQQRTRRAGRPVNIPIILLYFCSFAPLHHYTIPMYVYCTQVNTIRTHEIPKNNFFVSLSKVLLLMQFPYLNIVLFYNRHCSRNQMFIIFRCFVINYFKFGFRSCSGPSLGYHLHPALQDTDKDNIIRPVHEEKLGCKGK